MCYRLSWFVVVAIRCILACLLVSNERVSTSATTVWRMPLASPMGRSCFGSSASRIMFLAVIPSRRLRMLSGYRLRF